MWCGRGVVWRVAGQYEVIFCSLRTHVRPLPPHYHISPPGDRCKPICETTSASQRRLVLELLVAYEQTLGSRCGGDGYFEPTKKRRARNTLPRRFFDMHTRAHALLNTLVPSRLLGRLFWHPGF